MYQLFYSANFRPEWNQAKKQNYFDTTCKYWKELFRRKISICMYLQYVLYYLQYVLSKYNDGYFDVTDV